MHALLTLLVQNNTKLGTATITMLGRGTRLLLRIYEARHHNGDQDEVMRLARLYASMLGGVITSTGSAIEILERNDLPGS